VTAALVRKKVATTNRVAQVEIEALDLLVEVIGAVIADRVQVVREVETAAKADAPISAVAVDAPSTDPSISS
jgi:hypothetical protein